MAHVILMPKAGQSMTEGRIVSWFKKEGDAVSRGEPLMEIETDKAGLEVEAQADGVLRRVFVPEGESCIVLAPVGIIAGADESIDEDALKAAALAEAEAAAANETPKASPAARKRPASAAPKAQPRSAPRPVARAAAVVPAASTPTASLPTANVAIGSAIAVTSGVKAPLDARGRRVLASPLARRLARERSVDLASLRGTGPGGRIVRRDVEAAPSNGRAAAGVRVAGPGGSGRPYPPPSPALEADEPLTGMRGAIARALQDSKGSIPHFYTTMAIDVTEALAHKDALAAAGIKVTINDLVVRAVSLALIDEPRVNCRVHDDHIEYPEDVNIGVAVGSDAGLVVPVLLRSQAHDLTSLAASLREIVASAQRGKLVGSGHGTFTISNLGMFGVESFSAIINPPEGAILAVGGVNDELVVRGGGFFPRSILRVTLSADHRAIDGVVAARFLSRVRYFLETATL